MTIPPMPGEFEVCEHYQFRNKCTECRLLWENAQRAARIRNLEVWVKDLKNVIDNLASWTDRAAHRGVGGHGPSENQLLKAVADARWKADLAMKELKL